MPSYFRYRKFSLEETEAVESGSTALPVVHAATMQSDPWNCPTIKNRQLQVQLYLSFFILGFVVKETL
jgi:hypothetical protein